LKHADVALYVDKRKKSRVEFYDPSLDTSSPRRLEMLTLLRAAVAKGELTLHFQPKVTMQTGEVEEVEALCRWNSPTLGSVSPAEFIPLAEASDVIKPLTEWTIRQALLECRRWHDAGVNLKVAVNLSARHMQDAHLPGWLDGLFSTTGSRPEWLELEITESAIMMDPDRAARVLQALRDLGVTISIDDFGTGYSSLAYLRTLAVDRLKIDRSFIADLNAGHKEEVIVESTIKLAHGLGLQAVAEGIENETQYAILRALGCDFAQGYLVAKPMPVEQLMQWWARRDTALPASGVTRSARIGQSTHLMPERAHGTRDTPCEEKISN
jgi:EAL domain-containing protein (putative c-di-GMP-specific phosphodiesterase class I)